MVWLFDIMPRLRAAAALKLSAAERGHPATPESELRHRDHSDGAGRASDDFEEW